MWCTLLVEVEAVILDVQQDLEAVVEWGALAALAVQMLCLGFRTLVLGEEGVDIQSVVQGPVVQEAVAWSSSSGPRAPPARLGITWDPVGCAPRALLVSTP